MEEELQIVPLVSFLMAVALLRLEILKPTHITPLENSIDVAKDAL
ncbi:hypothetical protein [Exiguobacterium acetylicum]|nr:hypothetical protein [Exiguobacterium acetylicum]